MKKRCRTVPTAAFISGSAFQKNRSVLLTEHTVFKNDKAFRSPFENARKRVSYDTTDFRYICLYARELPFFLVAFVREDVSLPSESAGTKGTQMQPNFVPRTFRLSAKRRCQKTVPGSSIVTLFRARLHNFLFLLDYKMWRTSRRETLKAAFNVINGRVIHDVNFISIEWTKHIFINGQWETQCKRNQLSIAMHSRVLYVS